MADSKMPGIDIIPRPVRLFATKERWEKILPSSKKTWLQRFTTIPVSEWSEVTMEIFASFKLADGKRVNFEHKGVECGVNDSVTAKDKQGRTIEGIVTNLINDKVLIMVKDAKKPIMVDAVDVLDVERFVKKKKKKKMEPENEAAETTVRFPKIEDTVFFKFQPDGQTFKGKVIRVKNPTITVQCAESMAPTRIHKSMIHKVTNPTDVVDEEDLFGNDNVVKKVVNSEDESEKSGEEDE